MPLRVRLVQCRARQSTAWGGGLPLVVFELVGTLAAHAVEAISSARVLHPRMATLGTIAKLPKPQSPLSTLSAPFQNSSHGTSMPDLASGHAARRAIRSCRIEGTSQVAAMGLAKSRAIMPGCRHLAVVWELR